MQERISHGQKSATKEPETEYASVCDGMATAQPMIRMKLFHTFRHTSALATGMDNWEIRRAVYWNDRKR